MAFIKQLVRKILIVIARPARLLECLVRSCLLCFHLVGSVFHLVVQAVL